MRWWIRLAVTVIVAPLLWRLSIAYVASQQAATWADLAQQSVGILASVYLTFTLPALVLCGVVLTLSDRLLHAVGLDLATVAVSPIIAGLVAAAILHWVQDPRVQAAEGAVVLAAVYGLVWGLTIREPRERVRGGVRRQSAGGTPWG